MTNLNLYDKFVIMAKAMGNKIESSGKTRSPRANSKELPPASFDTLSSFLGQM